jgi:hypothetical protein
MGIIDSAAVWEGVRRRLRAFPLARTALAVSAMAVLSACSLAFFPRGDAAACRNNLKQYSLAMLMYCQDYDEVFPPTKSPAQTQNRVLPYTKNRSVFSCPDTGAEYLPNPALNHVSQATIREPAKMLLLRDAKPHTDGDRPFWIVAYADGHTGQVNAEPRLGKLAPAPRPPSRAEQIDRELRTLRMQKNHVDGRIRQLEREKRRLPGR